MKQAMIVSLLGFACFVPSHGILSQPPQPQTHLDHYENPGEQDQILHALSRRDLGPSLEELRTIAGSDDRLVSRLLELRAADVLPFVQIRSAKLLISYSSRPEVQRALLDDVLAPNRLGLVRVYARAIDQLPAEGFRTELAARIVERASHAEEYQSAVKLLSQAQDPGIRALAQGASRVSGRQQ
jgi:hypothetical protein